MAAEQGLDSKLVQEGPPAAGLEPNGYVSPYFWRFSTQHSEFGACCRKTSEEGSRDQEHLTWLSFRKTLL